MENAIESAIDSILDRVFGGVKPQVLLTNVIVGIVLVFLGLRFLKNKSFDGKNMIGWILLGIGCLSLLSGVVQLFNLFVS